MPDVSSFLRAVLVEIEPTANQKAAASRSHVALRDDLDSGQMGKRIVDSYLSGSYPRDTAIRPIDDVDIILAIDPSEWLGVLDQILGAKPSPEKVLQSFAAAIRYRRPNSSVRVQRRSVRLQMERLDIDVVPAIPGADGVTIHIPDTEEDGWIKSAPKRHAELATEVNKGCYGLFKPEVKLLKSWNGAVPSTAGWRSFAVETLALRLFRHAPMESLHQGLIAFWDFVAYLASRPTVYRWSDACGVAFSVFGIGAPSVPDAAGTGSNTAAGIDLDRQQKFVEQAIRARDRALDALATGSLDRAEGLIAEALKL